MQKRERASLKRTWPLHMMLLPGVILLFIFSYVPMGGIIIAFQKFKPALGLFGRQKWVELKNFEYVLSLPNFEDVIRNTLVMSISKIVLCTLTSIAFALLLNELRTRRYKRTVQTIIYFPHFLSWVILAGIFTDMLSPSKGVINHLLGMIGVEPIFFLGDENWFPAIMIITDVWKEFGYGTVLYMAAISGIDPTQYEAAAIDGAGRWRQTMNVILPGMKHIIVLQLVLNIGGILNGGFDQVYNMLNSLVFETGDILDTLVFRMGFTQQQWGPSTAIGLFKSAISFVLISAAYYTAYKKFDYQIF